MKDHKVLPPEAPAEVEAKRLSAPLLETLLELLHGWAPAFRQRRTRALALALEFGHFRGVQMGPNSSSICSNLRRGASGSAAWARLEPGPASANWGMKEAKKGASFP